MYEKCDKKIKTIISKVQKYMGDKISKEVIQKEILKAYDYAKQAHEGQMRLSGDPYLIHPVEATEILLDLNPDLDTIQACLLHDVIEDTPKTADDIEKDFGPGVRFLCEGMEKLAKVRYTGEDRSIGSLRKMFVAMAEDLRVIFIKLSDRVHNMKTLKFHPKKEKRTRIALETLNVYAPIADRLGLHKIKNILQEECFKILETKEYKKLKHDLKKLEESKKVFKSTAKAEIEKLLKAEDIDFEIDFRVKSLYSIYKKMKRKNIEDVRDLYDVYGIRIIVNDVATCYKVLGMIHNRWTPLPKRFKDYIALPKPNGYKSLHTTVIGLLKNFSKQPTEIQIKTLQMHKQADIGVAAHFEYKEKGSKIAHDIDWVKELKEMTENLEGNKEFVDSLKIDVFKDRIFVLTPKGDSISLPASSTPVDFAYEIHTELGNHISIAKVNGKVVPLHKELQNGDVVEVITDKNKNPNPFWLSFVKTNKAKNRIKAYLNEQNQDEYIERGKKLLNTYLEKLNLPPLDKDFSILKVFDGKENNMEDRKNILERIGNFSISAGSVVKKIYNFCENSKHKKTVKKVCETKNEKGEKIIVGDDKDLKYKKCKICNPIPGDKIVAYISQKGQITIHKIDCSILQEGNKDRYLPAYFEGYKQDKISFDLILTVKNRKGIIKDIGEVAYNMDLDILNLRTEKPNLVEGKVYLSLEYFGVDFFIMDRFTERLKSKLSDTIEKIELKNVSL